MNKENTPEEDLMIEREFAALLNDYKNTVHRQKVEIITKAFHFARQAHKGVRRRSGEPYIMHPLAVARIVVSEIGLGSTSICSALLHDVVEDTEYTTEDIRNLFGDKIASIVDGLTKISGGVFGEQASVQAENFRKLLLTMSEDIRVVLIKIADRLHNMRTLEFQAEEKRYKIAGETQYIYAPLAHRLGLFAIKTELENLSFKYEHPDSYKEIADKLAANKDMQMQFFEQFSEPIREKLDNMGYEFDLNARIKSVYSIWNKMQAKNIPFEDIYDLLAVRIIFTPKPDMSEKDQCWMIYSALTSIYKPHPERIRDWISTPKTNGYEALHVTVMGQNGQWVEVQIRTRRMHEIAERGLAAHWKYKLGSTDETELDKWLKTIKDLLQHPEPTAMDFLDTFKLNLFASELFVFTPKGDIRTMPKGSTALDFAFALHTNLGLHCTGAKVNHQLEPLNYVLNGGDQIEILSSPDAEPQTDWIDYVTTAKARQTLRAFFRRKDRQYIKQGEELFAEELDSQGLLEQYETILHKALNYYHIQQPSQLMLQIGKGVIELQSLQPILQPAQGGLFSYFRRSFGNNSNNNTDFKEQDDKKPKKDEKGDKHLYLTDLNFGKIYHIASCCHPIPGDEVLGYKDSQGAITIHKRNCPVANKLKSSDGKNIYLASWNMSRSNTFIETIEIRGFDKVGMMIQVMKILSEDFKINIHDLHITTEGGIFNGTLQIGVYDTKEVQDVCNAIRKVNGIESVQRVVHLDGIEDIAELD